MVNEIRRQLTLFVDPNEGAIIEKVRQEYNPRQYELIKSHVTLCREDEIEDIETVIINVSNLTIAEVEIEFGKPVRFSNGKGVLLPALPGYTAFQELRRQILSRLFENPRLQEPHITLMHPRNSTCTDEMYKDIYAFDFPTKLIFKKIDLIEQMNGGQWKIVKTFSLAERKQKEN